MLTDEYGQPSFIRTVSAMTKRLVSSLIAHYRYMYVCTRDERLLKGSRETSLDEEQYNFRSLCLEIS
jgi:hypothetical protein